MTRELNSPGGSTLQWGTEVRLLVLFYNRLIKWTEIESDYKLTELKANKRRHITNPLERRANHNSATSNNMTLVHWPLIGGLLHLVQRGGSWAGLQPPSAMYQM